MEARGFGVTLDEFVESWFVDRGDAIVEFIDFGLIDVEACDIIACISEAGSGYESDVACADHSDTHGDSSLSIL